MDDLLPEFLTETNEALAELDLALVKLESDPGDKPTLALIFRMVHTIKGTCGFLGLPRLEHVAHAGENVLGRVRDGELAATPAVVSLVLKGLDRIKSIVEQLGATGAEPQGDDQDLILALNRMASGEPEPAVNLANPPPEPIPKPQRPSAGAEQAPSKHEGEAPAVAPPAAMPPPVAPQAAQASAVQETQTIRVTVDVLEELMTLVGELVLTRNQLMQIARAEAAAKGATSVFNAPLQRLSQITTDLQDGVMKTRMQPIGSAWNKLPRLVRDLAQETGKIISLEMQGQNTELDRQVLELMRDPLTHMVRNSADHGLETPSVRRAAGKPDCGRIMLNAYHEGGQIIVEISDDGRGIDVARVRAKVLAQGLANEAELATMTEAQVRAFIFRAGFSTAEAVTAISGRGVGMDVVRANIERIGGTIDLASTQGAGSCFTIKIPLTLAIVSAVIVEAGGERFAIPQTAVRELVRVGESGRGAAGTAGARAATTIEQVGGAAVLRLRDELLPLVDLATLLELDELPTPQATAEQGTTVVIVAVGQVKLGIVVAEVFDTEEIVVKPVAPVLRHVTMFGGNTILGDGSVIMILDPNGLARSAGIAARPASGAADAVQSATRDGSEERVPVLLFRAGGSGVLAVPLSLVARLEKIESARIEQSNDGLVIQYRGALMKLVFMDEETRCAPKPTQPVLVFADQARSMGLIVDEIIDVVHGHLRVEFGSRRPGVLGTAIVAGKAVDVLDTSYWLTLAFPDWFSAGAGRSEGRRRVLVVEDSDFFRQMLVPTLSTHGYEVIAVRDGRAALALRESGLVIDAIVSDIEMPEMDGLAFATAARQAGAWSRVPLIALSANGGAADVERARQAGFSDYVEKSQRDALIASLRACLEPPDSQAGLVCQPEET